jgi:hypothetical protein
MLRAGTVDGAVAVWPHGDSEGRKAAAAPRAPNVTADPERGSAVLMRASILARVRWVPEHLNGRLKGLAGTDRCFAQDTHSDWSVWSIPTQAGNSRACLWWPRCQVVPHSAA